MWSLVGAVHAIWALVVTGVLGWLLGSEVLSSTGLGIVFAISLPLSMVAARLWSQRRSIKRTPPYRLFVGSGIQFALLRNLSESKFPSENWFVITGGPALIGFAHPLSRWSAFVGRIALDRLLRDRERLAAAAAVDPKWIVLILVTPGSSDAKSIVVNGTPVQVLDAEQAGDTIRYGLRAPDIVRASLLLAFR